MTTPLDLESRVAELERSAAGLERQLKEQRLETIEALAFHESFLSTQPQLREEWAAHCGKIAEFRGKPIIVAQPGADYAAEISAEPAVTSAPAATSEQAGERCEHCAGTGKRTHTHAAPMGRIGWRQSVRTCSFCFGTGKKLSTRPADCQASTAASTSAKVENTGSSPALAESAGSSRISPQPDADAGITLRMSLADAARIGLFEFLWAADFLPKED
jgi:hypothetical protein